MQDLVRSDGHPSLRVSRPQAARGGCLSALLGRARPPFQAAGVVYHTYSTYARGLDGVWGMYQWLDRAPKGRNETGVWWRRHDEYVSE